MLAMAQYEGWTQFDQSGNFKGSRSYRTHNPGNLRDSIFECGKDEGYSVFKNDLIGWVAFHYDLLKKSKGETSSGLNGSSTIKDLIFKYAPMEDQNIPQAYLNFVTLNSGLPESTTLAELFI
jgi:hypothetical protein